MIQSERGIRSESQNGGGKEDKETHQVALSCRCRLRCRRAFPVNDGSKRAEWSDALGTPAVHSGCQSASIYPSHTLQTSLHQAASNLTSLRESNHPPSTAVLQSAATVPFSGRGKYRINLHCIHNLNWFIYTSFNYSSNVFLKPAVWLLGTKR